MAEVTLDLTHHQATLVALAVATMGAAFQGVLLCVPLSVEDIEALMEVLESIQDQVDGMPGADDVERWLGC